MGITNIKKYSAEAPDGYKYPNITDFKAILVLTPLFMVLEHFGTAFLEKLFINIIKGKDDPEEAEARCKKAANNLYFTFFITYQTVFGYMVLKD